MTIKDIARLAGVTPTTVSNVINGNSGRVSRKTIDKVEAVIQEQGYIPNRNARALANKSTRIIGVIFPKVLEGLLQDPFHSQLLSGIQSEISNSNYYLMVHSIESYEDLYKLLANWNVEGIVILSLLDNEQPNSEMMKDVPAVFIDAYNEDLSYPNIGSEDFEGAAMAARHLLDMGHRKIGFIGFETVITSHSSVISRRIEGFRSVMENENIPFSTECDIFHCDRLHHAPDGVKQKLIDFSRSHSAVFVSADILAVEIMSILQKEGFRIPEDISIIGYDNIYLSELITPPLTTIGQNITLKGSLAAKHLIKQIEEKKHEHLDYKLPNTLVKRESVLDLNTP
ncbi:MAG: LacI family DNA-binding transcriptional regulator [Spirochaetales bacterium]|nr:LacI family DNA-binding transcriptional regulator [Spirochaetales bacterium]